MRRHTPCSVINCCRNKCRICYENENAETEKRWQQSSAAKKLCRNFESYESHFHFSHRGGLNILRSSGRIPCAGWVLCKSRKIYIYIKRYSSWKILVVQNYAKIEILEYIKNWKIYIFFFFIFVIIFIWYMFNTYITLDNSCDTLKNELKREKEYNKRSNARY